MARFSKDDVRLLCDLLRVPKFICVQMEQWLVDKSPCSCYSGGLPIPIAYQIFALCLVDLSQS